MEVMSSPFSFAQITDCHLYAEKNALHYGANVYQNLCEVLSVVKADKQISMIIFTGDLTQDHSEQSYQNFVDACQYVQLNKPVYFLAGNHDEPELLKHYLVNEPFNPKLAITLEKWQIQLIKSKGETPAGYWDFKEQQRVIQSIDRDKNQFLFMHHHPVDVGYFIDRHGLENQADFYQFLTMQPNIRAIGCGHIHNALNLDLTLQMKSVPVFTCPSTSIQFDKKADTVKSSGLSAGFRKFYLFDDGSLQSSVHFL